MGRSRAETSLLWSVTGTKSSDSVCLSRKPGPRGVLPLPSPPPILEEDGRPQRHSDEPLGPHVAAYGHGC